VSKYFGSHVLRCDFLGLILEKWNRYGVFLLFKDKPNIPDLFPA
jgi:hypothetical protein